MESTINPQATGLQMFYNEEANVSIRTELVNDEPWFVAKDIATALEIAWTGHTLDRIPDDWKGAVSFTTPCGNYRGGGEQSLRVINESAMYKLAFRSNKPEADRFVNWIASEVLPSIRRTGSYSVNGIQSPVKAITKLPLPKFRPYYQEWKDKVTPYLCEDDTRHVADILEVTYSHVRKVYMGTSVSEPVAQMLTTIARINREKGVRYEPRKSVYEQLSIEFEEEKQ